MESIIKVRVKEMASQKPDNAQLEEDNIDPAKFLFKHSEYHDCYFLVGDPASESLEKIGVVSSQLVAHSPVFRVMLKNKEVDTTQINVSGVTPEMFKLMLTHMYGGELPELDFPTAAQLALCADMYLIQPLVDRACKLIVPSCVAEVFPALWCVSYISCPILEPQVTKIIQEETKAVIESSSEFLDLDPKCLEYITKQEQLAVTEFELWKALVEWARNKVEVDPSKTMRQHLEPALQHVRLATFSQEDVIKEVVPTKILESTEVIELLTAITSNQDWGFPGLFKANKIRGISTGVSQKINESTEESKNNLKESTLFKTECIFNHNKHEAFNCSVEEQKDYETTSNFTLKIIKNIQLNSFTFKARAFLIQKKQPVYRVDCSILVTKVEKGLSKSSQIIQVGGSVVSGESVVFPLILKNGQRLQLEANSSYNFYLEFSVPHPVFLLVRPHITYSERKVRDSSNNELIMTLKYNTPAHVESISLNF